jgi:hypothetical protein
MNFQGLARSVLLREWQGKWDAVPQWTLADSLTPYSRRFLFVLGLTVKRRTGSHLSRFGIVEGAICYVYV